MAFSPIRWTMDGETVLLTDEQATQAAIQEEVWRLETAATHDVVVVAFSGHGSETHELVAYDTDPDDIAGTSIPLTIPGEWCARIPCRRLLIVLDCCFSGEMGAKALQVDARPRQTSPLSARLRSFWHSDRGSHW